MTNFFLNSYQLHKLVSISYKQMVMFQRFALPKKSIDLHIFLNNTQSIIPRYQFTLSVELDKMNLYKKSHLK